MSEAISTPVRPPPTQEWNATCRPASRHGVHDSRDEIDAGAVGRGFEVMLDVEPARFDRASADGFEQAMAGFDEVTELHRLFGSPDDFVRIVVADLEAYERFLRDHGQTLPAIRRVSSRFTMKAIKR